MLARSDASAWKADERRRISAAGSRGRPVSHQGDDRRRRPRRLRPRRRGDRRGPRPQGRAPGPLAEACPDADLADHDLFARVGRAGDAGGRDRPRLRPPRLQPRTRMELVELCLPERLGDGVPNAHGPSARRWASGDRGAGPPGSSSTGCSSRTSLTRSGSRDRSWSPRTSMTAWGWARVSRWAR